MCGIAGFLEARLQAEPTAMEAVAARMVDSLAHRGPDDRGVWVESASGVALGNRRLAILDLSPAGHQPMRSHSGRFVLAHNGEIYNFCQLRKELDSAGVANTWAGHSDTEVMLAAFEKWGVAQAVAKLDGMFAFAVWDRAERILHLGRDRMGEKPLYYGCAGGALIFASELKALLQFPRFVPEVDRHALRLFLRYNYVPSPHCIYRGIHKLPAATLLSVRPAEVERGLAEPEPYWSLEQAAQAGLENPFRGTEEEALEELRRLLSNSVGLRMLADVPVGSFLSGGIDSSLVTSLMQAQSSVPVKTYSIGFQEKEYNEGVHAAAVARHLGTEHNDLCLTAEQAISVIPQLPTIYDEPFADSSQIPTFLVSQLARSQVTVALSGDGGDELFGGYTRHVWAAPLWSQCNRLPGRRLAASALRSVPTHVWDAVLTLGRSPSSRRSRLPGQKLHKLALILEAKNGDAVYEAMATHWRDPAALFLSPDSGTSEASDWLATTMPDLTQQMMLLDAASFLPDDVLVKVDRASMAVSLEARVPLLDHRIVEFAWSLPLTMKIRRRRGKWILRQLLYRYVPRQLVDRPKAGFSVPLDRWLRGLLRDWAESLLAKPRLLANGFRPEPIRQAWKSLLAGRGLTQHAIWGILMYQAWLEQSRPALRESSNIPQWAKVAAPAI